jgi:hypothetical protein
LIRIRILTLTFFQIRTLQSSKNDPLRLPTFHFDTDPDPDPAFYFDDDLDPNPTFHFDPDPDLQHWHQDFSKSLCMYGTKEEFDNSKIAQIKIKIKFFGKVGSYAL